MNLEVSPGICGARLLLALSYKEILRLEPIEGNGLRQWFRFGVAFAAGEGGRMG